MNRKTALKQIFSDEPGILSTIEANETEPTLKRMTDFLSVVKGEQGEKGDTGEKGDRGDKGEIGDQGIQGEKGDPGKDGRDGRNGLSGSDGKDGKDGKDGRDGKDSTINIDKVLEPVNKKIDEISNTLSAKGKIDQRWHGGGLSKVTTDSSLTGQGTGSSPLSVAGAGAVTINYIIDGGGSAITTGVKGFVEIPYNMTITGWQIFADQVGSVVVDVWKDVYANFPPTVADTITGSEKPTLASAQSNQDLSLTTWTTSLIKGDILAYNVDSASTIQRITISIIGVKS